MGYTAKNYRENADKTVIGGELAIVGSGIITKDGQPVSLGGASSVSAAEITDATETGRAVLTAADQAAARTAIGAGISNLALGTTSTTAKAGNYVPAWADVTGKPTAFVPVSATVTVTGGGSSR
jgi:hypothetical protein